MYFNILWEDVIVFLQAANKTLLLNTFFWINKIEMVSFHVFEGLVRWLIRKFLHCKFPNVNLLAQITVLRGTEGGPVLKLKPDYPCFNILVNPLKNNQMTRYLCGFNIQFSLVYDTLHFSAVFCAWTAGEYCLVKFPYIFIIKSFLG